MKRASVIAIVAAIVTLVAIGFFVQRKISPPVKDIYFALDPHTPPNLVVIRPAHFVMPDARGNYEQDVTNNGEVSTYLSGRDVTIQQMIGVAYSFSRSRIVFPPDMPTNQFDYLVTVPGKEGEELQAAIKSKFGYIGHEQNRNAEVLALKVESPNLPGLQISTNNVMRYVAGKLFHFKVNILVAPIENRLQQPVVNETGLTNFYDFRWNFRPRDRATIDKQLAGLGLGLEPTNQMLNMLVVEKAR